MTQTIKHWEQIAETVKGIGAGIGMGIGMGIGIKGVRKRIEANRMWRSFLDSALREEGIESESEFETIWETLIENYLENNI